MNILHIFIIILLTSVTISAQSITDIEPSDAHFNAIKKSINLGYLSLFNNSEFKPNTSLTRRDAAIMLSKLNNSLNKSPNTLPEQTYKELNQFSNEYKTFYTTQQNKLSFLTHQITTMQTEQKVLHHENTKLYDVINQLQNQTEKLKKERIILYSLIATTGLIGIIF